MSNRSARRHPAPRCEVCGELLGQPGSALYQECRWPQPVLDDPSVRDAPGFWMSGTAADSSEAMIAPGLGAFVRVMIPILLDDATQLTLVPWAHLEPDAFADYVREREQDAVGPVFEGTIANRMPVWRLDGAHVSFSRLRSDDLAFVVASDDAVVRRLLTERIPRREAYELVGPHRPPTFDHRPPRG